MSAVEVSAMGVTKGYGSNWIFGPCLTCANALRRVQHPAFSLVCGVRKDRCDGEVCADASAHRFVAAVV